MQGKPHIGEEAVQVDVNRQRYGKRVPHELLVVCVQLSIAKQSVSFVRPVLWKSWKEMDATCSGNVTIIV